MSDLLAARIAGQAAEVPRASAVVDRRERIDYRDFWSRVVRTAAGLDGMRRIAVLPTSDIESLVVVTAAMHAGVSVVLLHRHLLPAQRSRVLELAEPAAVVAAPHQHRRLRRLGFEGSVRTAATLESAGLVGGARPDSELLVGITSGTTGEPKLFVRDQRSWATTLDRSDRMFGIGADDRVSVPGVLDHTHFLYGALHALTRGATVDLRPVVQSLTDGATHLYSVPTIAWDVVRAGIGPIESVREVLSSAARWPRTGRRALQEVLPNASLVHFYGASELSFVSFDRGLGAADENSVGELFDGVEARIRDGLVYVRSDMLFGGYLTADGVVDGPVDGWLTVGDRGRVIGNRLYLFGRDSEMLIRAGLNVEPAAVEAALTAIPGIAEAACIGIADERMGQAPAAAIVVDSAAPSIDEIWRRLRATLPSPSMPVRILTVDSLPRTPRGKLDRQALAATLAAHRGGGPAGDAHR
ncbi:AMP-binding protein [Nocardia amamiensis]|uniref:AMP-binding protein n=1 Tax=Nocardia amamiensis TaxID=404578 RepID=A0ABS0CUT3_9NOCA|nr:AMP-binding protein [Nocardia amamiensis]MBF6300071.1 AMP-binding protein [Nocardia amamiensis]